MNKKEIQTLINLTDPRLFGNEAAEDEDPGVLDSYFVEKPEFKIFEDEKVPLSIVRARKGVGKSALLARGAYSKNNESPKPLVISIIGADLVAQRPFKVGNASELIYDWQQRICSRINVELGREIGLALDDASISLVEASELSGFKDRNIIGSLLDRLKGKLGNIETTKLVPQDAQQLLQRYMERHRNRNVWLFIDDVDATFHRTEVECLRLSTFFSACRILTNSVRGLLIRTAVRTDVWTSIRSSDEALDKCEQYIFDQMWSRKGTGSILAKRIKSYLLRRLEDHWITKDILQNIPEERRRLIEEGLIKPSWAQSESIETLKDNQLIRLIFPPHPQWGLHGGAPNETVHVLSAGRPRWALQLCKLAAREASTSTHIIRYGHIREILERYGQFRIDDLIKEHFHQCPEIEEIIHAFARQKGRYSTDELLAFIETAILTHIKVHLDSTEAINALPIAHFLFRIGFFSGRDDRDPPHLTYYRYEEKPHLLKTVTNIDEGLIWSIHPSLRGALNLTLPD